jgi:gamma-glutamyltranspeptidase/glutathione hydrolase
MEDLKQHGMRGSEFTEAISLRLDQGMRNLGNQSGSGGICVWEHPPNGQGIVALMALGILQELHTQGRIPKFQPEDHNSPQSVTLLSCVELGADWALTSSC